MIVVFEILRVLTAPMRSLLLGASASMKQVPALEEMHAVPHLVCIALCQAAPYMTVAAIMAGLQSRLCRITRMLI